MHASLFHTITTWIVVPALAGSTPVFANAKGKPVPKMTEVMTIRNRDSDIEKEFLTSPFVRYT
jgi:hypothetical protein